MKTRPFLHELAVALLVLPAIAATSRAQSVPQGNSGVRGTVTDNTGRPLAGALVLRDGSADTARADSSGRFAVQRLALGRHVFRVAHPGFASIEFEVQFERDTTVSLDIPLERGVSIATTTGGAGGKLDAVGFTARRQAAEGGRGGATYIGPESLLTRRGQRLSQVLDGVRDVTVRVGRDNVIILYGHDRRCMMNVWIEGRKLDNVFPPSENYSNTGSRRRMNTAVTRYPGLDDIIPVEQILAIEVYPRPSQTPPQFQAAMSLSSGLETRDLGNCGSLVIWTP